MLVKLLALLSALHACLAAEISNLRDRYVEQAMADLPENVNLNMSVQMLGLEVQGSHVLGHLVRVDNPIGRVSLATPPGGCGTREYTTVTAQKHEPQCRLAINAGYFNVTDAACIGNLVADSTVIQTVPLNESNVNFGIRGGRFAIGYFTPEEVQGFEQLVSGVTWLVKDGKSYVDRGWAEANITVQTSGHKYVGNLASRTAVGVDREGRLMLVQIDGSIAIGHNKRGMNMYQLADLLIEHGAIHAINLDGGGSSAMSQDGMLINYPSDSMPPSCDESGKYQCERPVSTILCVHDLPRIWIGATVRNSLRGSAQSGTPLIVVGAVFFAAGCTAFFGFTLLHGKRHKGHKKRSADMEFPIKETDFSRELSDSILSSDSDGAGTAA